MMRILILFLILMFSATGAYAGLWSKDEPQQVTIADPYIELHTGPGSAYPVFYVIERGQTVEVIRRQTDMFKLRTETGKEGWATREQMVRTLSADGEPIQITDPGRGDFAERKWEMGVTAGEIGDAAVLSLYGGYAFNENLSAELTASESIGNLSSSISLMGSVLAQPFPEWRVSPFFSLGTGVMQTRPLPTLVIPENTTNQFAQVGVGIKTYVTRRFIFRFEVNEINIFSASNESDSNEVFTEWKMGFGVFF
jgi:hypothetical protein